MIIAAYLAISVCVLLLPGGISFRGINGALLKTIQIRGRNDECYNNAKSLFQLFIAKPGKQNISLFVYVRKTSGKFF